MGKFFTLVLVVFGLVCMPIITIPALLLGLMFGLWEAEQRK